MNIFQKFIDNPSLILKKHYNTKSHHIKNIIINVENVNDLDLKHMEESINNYKGVISGWVKNNI